ncbi:DUF1236 domain-containing protein [Roseovarius sp. D0-M9]|uniref:DUF1236 domain-containing protein n=1 Tax=Roseovarius sp. D0-M9 TaxID=3127117 RepID=UPI0030104526
MSIKMTLGAALAVSILSSAATAQTSASAWTDLNLRAGPGPQFEIIDVIPASGEVAVAGCLESASWCKVTHNGTVGWASGDYLTTIMGEERVAIYPNRESVSLETVVHSDTSDETTAASGVTGAIAGALIGGPVGAVIGGVAGASAGAAIDPGPTVTTYVQENPRDVIYLDGEVVVGAGVPETVKLSEVPDSTYSYAYINGVPVIIEREDRRIIQIVR